MGLFNREIPSKVIADDDPPKSSDAPSPRKENQMDNQQKPKGSLLDIMPSKRKGGTERPAGAAPSAPPSSPGGGTFINGDTVIEGKIMAQGELCIDGTFKGDLISSGRVVVGTAGKVEGTVESKSLVLSGKVTGNLHILERLELLSTGELVGDLQTQPGALIIEKGARFEGRCAMGVSEGKGKGNSAPAPKKPADAEDGKE